MSKTKVFIVVVVFALIVAAGYYFLVAKKKETPTNLEASPTGDDTDNATVQAMAAAVSASKFKDELTYMMDIYPKYKQGGTNQPPATDYYTVVVPGKTNQRVVPNCCAFMQAVWNGWSSTYVLNPQPASVYTPAAGKSVEDAKAAAELCQQIAGIYGGFKTSYGMRHL